MQIPIENIYYLLCYAWNSLEEKGRVSVSIDDKTTLLDLFAKVLINGIKQLLKRGIDRNYVSETAEISGVKGKLELAQTLKSNLLLQQKTICTFDEFSANILPNQILVSTILRLLKTQNLDNVLKHELRNLQRRFVEIEPIELHHAIFKNVNFHRNSLIYNFLMNVCEIIYDSTLPAEQESKFTFSDFTRDDARMNRLFENFVRNFYAIEQKEFSIVKRENIEWNFKNVSEESLKYLPQMQTDITLENEEQKIIIDAKFYRETMTLHYDKEKIKSANLYQLFSYLLNQESDGFKTALKTKSATGILLYPTIEEEYDLQFAYHEHNIYIRTVNLNAHWRDIAARLQKIISF
ncbi:MAG: 5-methylcytosine-specific restriction endonuclease system specificity protein McrC [Bacteroidota bacterium]